MSTWVYDDLLIQSRWQDELDKLAIPGYCITVGLCDYPGMLELTVRTFARNQEYRSTTRVTSQLVMGDEARMLVLSRQIQKVTHDTLLAEIQRKVSQ